jgi:hypothetical protein
VAKLALEMINRTLARLTSLKAMVGEVNGHMESAAGASVSHEDSFIGSIDQGTTSSRFLIFNRDGDPVASHQLEFKQYYPQPG